jgi:hypothetical protein
MYPQKKFKTTIQTAQDIHTLKSNNENKALQCTPEPVSQSKKRQQKWKASLRCKSCKVLKCKYTFYMSKENLTTSLSPQTILVFLSYILFAARSKKDDLHQNYGFRYSMHNYYWT